jgi:hypothetical protein
VETLLSDEPDDDPETLARKLPPLPNHAQIGLALLEPSVVHATTGLPRKISKKSGTRPIVNRKPGTPTLWSPGLRAEARRRARTIRSSSRMRAIGMTTKNNSRLATARTLITAGASQGLARPRRAATAPPITVGTTHIAATTTTQIGMM